MDRQTLEMCKLAVAGFVDEKEKTAKIFGATPPDPFYDLPAQHKRKLRKYIGKKAKEKPTSLGRALGGGAAIGGGLGALMGAPIGATYTTPARRPGKAALIGALVGLLGGAGLGTGMGALARHEDIKEIRAARKEIRRRSRKSKQAAAIPRRLKKVLETMGPRQWGLMRTKAGLQPKGSVLKKAKKLRKRLQAREAMA